MDSPYNYDESNAEDMKLWSLRRDAGVSWVTSEEAYEFAKRLYCGHATIFASALKVRANVKKTFEQYYIQRRSMEQGPMRQELEQLLQGIATGKGDVVDSFSFLTCDLINELLNIIL